MTEFLSDGFESGDFSEWTGQWVSDGSSSVASDWKHSGSYAGKFVVSANNGYADTYKNIGSRTTAYHRAYVRFSTLPTTGKSVVLVFLGDSGNNPIMALGLKYSGGSAKFFAAYLKNGNVVNLFSSANTPQVDTDYCVEIKASVSSSAGSVESWVDGVKDDGLSDTSGFDNDDGGNITYAFVGCDNYVEENYPLTVWVDDVVTADSYVGPQSGSGTDLTVTGNLTVNGNTELGGQLTTDATICNKAYYNLRDTDGSWINALLIENTSPNTDFHIAPNFETQTNGTSRVFFGYGSDWGSYNWMSETTTMLSLSSEGVLTTKNNNVLDDGSGNMTAIGDFNLGSGVRIPHDATNLPYSNVVLPTQDQQYYSSHYAYTTLGHGNILFEHTGNEQTYTAGKFASLYLVMISDPTGNSYNPFIATDEGFFVEKDFQTYGAVFTQSDPSKGTGGGAVLIGHGFYGSTGFPPCIVLPDEGYNTLHLLTNVNNMTRADLSLGTLDAQANVKIGIFSNTDDRGPLYASSSGYIGYPQSTIRVKENIQDLNDCSWLYNLRPVTFTWKNREHAHEGTRLGLIAEEVNEQCSQLIWLDGEGKPEGIHYEWLGIPLLVEVKKLSKRVDALETQLTPNSSIKRH